MTIARQSPAGPAFGHVGASPSLRGSMPVRSAAREWRLGRGPTLAGAGRRDVDGQGDRRRGEGGWGGGGARGKRGGRGGGGGGPETGLGAGAGGPGRRALAAPPCPPRLLPHPRVPLAFVGLGATLQQFAWPEALQSFLFALQWTIVTMLSTIVTIYHHLISQAGWNRCNLSILWGRHCNSLLGL